MLRITSIMVVLALAAVAQANTGTPDSSLSCSNGLFCANGETCMSNKQGAGAKFACSPHPNAVICSDLRHSCPSGSTCTNEMCTPSDGSASLPFKASTSKDAVSVGERTYGNGIYIHPSDAPGHVNDFGSDFCKLVAPRLANFCSCHSQIWNRTVWGPSGAFGWIRCDENIGDFIRTGAVISFGRVFSCNDNPGIDGCVVNGTGTSMSYSFWGHLDRRSEETRDEFRSRVSVLQQIGFSMNGGVPNFPANYQRSIRITEASLNFFGRGISTFANLSVTAINPNVVSVAIDLHACVEIGSVPAQNGTVAEGLSCASDKPNVVCSNQPGGRDLLRFAGVTVPISVMSNTFDLTDIINANRGN